MSNAVTTTGILLQRAPIGDPTNFTTVAELTKATAPGFSRNKLESSTHNDGTESNILGILRQSDGLATINYIASDPTHTQIMNDMMNNTKARWRYLFPSGISLSGDGRVGLFRISEAAVDGIQAADLSIVWSSPVVQA